MKNDKQKAFSCITGFERFESYNSAKCDTGMNLAKERNTLDLAKHIIQYGESTEEYYLSEESAIYVALAIIAYNESDTLCLACSIYDALSRGDLMKYLN